MNHIPSFEGHPVDATLIKMSGAAPLDELIDTVIGVDDVVQMLSQFRCVGVRHEINANGALVRVQILRPMEFALHPIDPTDPNDDGIVRALPSVLGTTVSNEPSE